MCVCVFENIYIHLHIDSRGLQYLRMSLFLDLKSSLVRGSFLRILQHASELLPLPPAAQTGFSASVIPEADGQERRR